MKILMIGAGRNVKGGVSTVVNQYFAAGLDAMIDLKYIATMVDGSKFKKLLCAAKAYILFSSVINKYDIVHVHMSHRSSFYRKSKFIKLAHKKGKKIVIHMHGSEFDIFYKEECNEQEQQEVRNVFKMADIVIALSEEWKDFLASICDEKKIVVLYNAVMLPDYKRNNYADKNILFLGRLGERKGSFDLIKAAKLVVKEVPDVQFFLGGDGDVDGTTELIEKLGMKDSVFYIGWVTGEKKEKYLMKCSTFVLPSYHEGMPMSILEAMSYGDVVISTNVGGIPKIIVNGENGYLIECGDIKHLAETLIMAIKTQDRGKIGGSAYETINNSFNLSKNVNKLVDLYSSI